MSTIARACVCTLFACMNMCAYFCLHACSSLSNHLQSRRIDGIDADMFLTLLTENCLTFFNLLVYIMLCIRNVYNVYYT